MQSKHPSLLQRSTLGSNSSRPHKHQHKHKLINKVSHNNEQVPLNKHAYLSHRDRKTDKHRTYQQFLSEEEVQRAFAVHQHIAIDQKQCVVSLKMLGCLAGQEGQLNKFSTLWNEKGVERIQFQIFQDILGKMYSKEVLQSSRDLFHLLSKSKPTMQLQTLQQMAQVVGWKGDVAHLLGSQLRHSSLPFQDFRKMMSYSQII